MIGECESLEWSVYFITSSPIIAQSNILMLGSNTPQSFPYRMRSLLFKLDKSIESLIQGRSDTSWFMQFQRNIQCNAMFADDVRLQVAQCSKIILMKKEEC